MTDKKRSTIKTILLNYAREVDEARRKNPRADVLFVNP